MKALLMVDLQNDFIPGGALPVPDGDAVMPVANRMQIYFNLVVATQDWHPANHGSFAANHTCLLYTSPSPRDATLSRMPSSA